MQGHLFPLVPVLEELRRRGHEVTVRSFASGVTMLRSLGFEAKPIATAIEARTIDDWRARTALGRPVRATRGFLDRAAREGPDLAAAVAGEKPDALIVDVLSLGAMATAAARKLPWAAFSPLPLLIPSPDTSPAGMGLPPARGSLGHVRDRVLQPLARASFDLAARAPLNSIRSEQGLGPLRHAHDLFLRPPLLLQMTSVQFEYPRSSWPPNVVMVGPCTWEPPGELPADLRAVEAPLVLITTSSDFQDDAKLVRTALEALAGEPCHVVATLPATRLEGPRPPANATVLPFAPHMPILARATCAVTHGGMGATQKALAAGVPVCAVPFGRDQFDVARRVEAADAGTRLPARRLSPERLRDKVREAMTKRAGAERIARSFAATGGAKTAVDAFEGQLRA